MLLYQIGTLIVLSAYSPRERVEVVILRLEAGVMGNRQILTSEQAQDGHYAKLGSTWVRHEGRHHQTHLKFHMQRNVAQ